jgi:UDP-4-amino-4-deoxy-L-arabinose formyltransferase/UDP-glucuronic acid dehydrogenase (UDP-4-keto-hexauronic acid decarboxylating)
MRIAIIGRTEILYDTALRLHEAGHQISCIVTAKEAPEYTRTSEDFGRLAGLWDVPFARGARILEHTDLLRASRSDIAVSINYTGVLPQGVIDLFPIGVLNAHGRDLPRYRGNACQAWAIINGESRIGLCIHKMIGGELDSGDIIARDYFAIDHTTKVTAAWNWMVERAPELMVEAVEYLMANPAYVLERQYKSSAEGSRCYPRCSEDGRIDWTRRSLEVVRLINACNKPYAGAFCDFDGKRMIIWDAELLKDDERFFAVPGQVLSLEDAYADVACGDGKIRIYEVEYSGVTLSPSVIIKSLRARLK